MPAGFTPQETVTLPNNVVTVFHTVTSSLLLPVIVEDATEQERPEYSYDVGSSAPWAEGVETTVYEHMLIWRLVRSVLFDSCLLFIRLVDLFAIKGRVYRNTRS